MSWETVIGLEVHIQLQTQSKIFSGAATAYGAEPNRQACPVTLALPGVLPVMNREAARLAVLFGLGINAEINRRSIFARKNYFYPDLPKGYQISQFEHPIIGRGSLRIATAEGGKTIEIIRAHLEEDAGKSLHEDFHGMTGIDLNRAGTPLLEVVSAADMRTAAEAVAYLKKLHTLVRYLGVSDANMQEGAFRCDANVSVRPSGQQELGVRTELKNINSFRFVERAIIFEAQRQIECLEQGGTITQETRLYDADRDETRPMRTKEDAHDYRYFPDPDLPELILEDDFIAAVRAILPELPEARAERFQREHRLSAEDATQLVAERAAADYFEKVCAATRATAKTVANWINGSLSAALNQDGLSIDQSPVAAATLATLLDRVEDQTISGKIAKEIFTLLWRGDASVDEIIEQKGLKQITDTDAIEAIVDEILADSAVQLAQYRDGNQKVFGYFVGQVMKRSQGRANPKQVNQLLQRKLGN